MNKRGEERERISLKTISFNETILGFLKTYYYSVCVCTRVHVRERAYVYHMCAGTL